MAEERRARLTYAAVVVFLIVGWCAIVAITLGWAGHWVVRPATKSSVIAPQAAVPVADTAIPHIAVGGDFVGTVIFEWSLEDGHWREAALYDVVEQRAVAATTRTGLYSFDLSSGRVWYRARVVALVNGAPYVRVVCNGQAVVLELRRVGDWVARPCVAP